MTPEGHDEWCLPVLGRLLMVRLLFPSKNTADVMAGWGPGMERGIGVPLGVATGVGSCHWLFLETAKGSGEVSGTRATPRGSTHVEPRVAEKKFWRLEATKNAVDIGVPFVSLIHCVRSLVAMDPWCLGASDGVAR